MSCRVFVDPVRSAAEAAEKLHPLARVVMLADKADDDAPYFSMVLLPGEVRRP